MSTIKELETKLAAADRKLKEVFYQARHCQRELRGGFEPESTISRLELIKNITLAEDVHSPAFNPEWEKYRWKVEVMRDE